MIIIETFERTQIVLKQTSFSVGISQVLLEVAGRQQGRGQEQKYLYPEGSFRHLQHLPRV